MSWTTRIRDEIREIGLVTIYFLSCFLFFLSLKKLILLEYDVRITVLGTAVISALVVAKVVILLGKTSFGSAFRSRSPLIHILWRSIVYTAVVFVVTLAERTFDQYREHGDFETALAKVWSGEDVGHFLALNVTVGVSLLLYNVWSEIDDHLGEGWLRRFLLSRPGASPPAAVSHLELESRRSAAASSTTDSVG